MEDVPRETIELAWCAGFFDGEGSTMALGAGTRNGTDGARGLRLRLAVHQAATSDGRPEVLERLVATLGGRIGGPYLPGERTSGFSPRRRAVYLWYIEHDAAELALVRLLPYLGSEKRRQAEIARDRVEATHRAHAHDPRCKHVAAA